MEKTVTLEEALKKIEELEKEGLLPTGWHANCRMPTLRRWVSTACASRRARLWGPISQRKKRQRITAVAWFVSFHVAAVRAVVIQLNFQNDKLELLFRKNKYTVF